MRARKNRSFTITGTLLILLLFLSVNLYGQSGIEPYDIERVGLTGWQFLKINGDARFAGMAGSFTALSHGDAGSVFGNPASLADIKGRDLYLSRVNWIADIGYQSAVFAIKLGKIGVFAVSVISMDIGDIEETINSPIPGEDRTEVVLTGNTYSAGDFAAGISYARNITDRLSVGANIRYIREEIADVAMDNVSVDFGTLYYIGLRSLRLAMTARNFGPDTHLVGWSEEYQAEAVDIRMPLDFRVGLAMDFFDSESSPHLLTVSVEGTHPNDGPEKINTGIEYSLGKILTLRGGYRFNYDEESYSFGGGLNYAIGRIGARLNYAFVDFGRLKNVHMFSLGFYF